VSDAISGVGDAVSKAAASLQGPRDHVREIKNAAEASGFVVHMDSGLIEADPAKDCSADEPQRRAGSMRMQAEAGEAHRADGRRGHRG